MGYCRNDGTLGATATTTTATAPREMTPVERVARIDALKRAAAAVEGGYATVRQREVIGPGFVSPEAEARPSYRDAAPVIREQRTGDRTPPSVQELAVRQTETQAAAMARAEAEADAARERREQRRLDEAAARERRAKDAAAAAKIREQEREEAALLLAEERALAQEPSEYEREQYAAELQRLRDEAAGTERAYVDRPGAEVYYSGGGGAPWVVGGNGRALAPAPAGMDVGKLLLPIAAGAAFLFLGS